MRNLFIFCGFVFLGCSSNAQQNQHADREKQFNASGQWANYGNDPGGMRHSPITQINAGNVKNLKSAWSYQTGELDTYKKTEIASKAAFEATPLMIDGILYVSTPTNRVIAIDAVTGKEKWIYDPQVNLKAGYSEVTSRGVSKWIDPRLKPGKPGYMRLFAATIDGRLIALDAVTGKPVPDFGKKGTVDLKEGVGRIQVTSPPAVINELVVVGSTMGDNTRIEFPAGVVRAYHARTGDLVWSWDPIPRKPADPGFETWKGNKIAVTGGANAWAPISADPQSDMVYVPTSCPSTDYYGGERLGDNLYANSLVAIQA
ncbi:MAG TPA: PQQ-binding-like beta-propeller repeat protein, partial [Chitinophagaceae bacterium]|nr:PQQ-binding-like beta-propeller repeat protein [Chitinophagaceae bacterium]